MIKNLVDDPSFISIVKTKNFSKKLVISDV